MDRDHLIDEARYLVGIYAERIKAGCRASRKQKVSAADLLQTHKRLGDLLNELRMLEVGANVDVVARRLNVIGN